eukprot:TRINITY_DN66729_c0_g1_i1.p1 TRINITY_DN66729_c0_g1~~TRINITY_DN66729_c0_g1_i1.p1  ORF type:complete len:411 (-),score=66.92 TRINITY_DN66729_c0_g1_i1:350-1537(-)
MALSVLGALAGKWRDLEAPRMLQLEQFLGYVGVSDAASEAVRQVACRAHKVPYPPHWSEQLDAARGAIYFYHSLRDEASWHHPLAETFKEVLATVSRLDASGAGASEMSDAVTAALAEAQRRAMADVCDWAGPLGSPDGAGPLGAGVYFFNRRTGESAWEDPRDAWQYDLQVRFDLLIGYFVAEEARDFKSKSSSPSRPPDQPPSRTDGTKTPPLDVVGGSRTPNVCSPRSWMDGDVTPTVDSLASSLSIVAGTLQSALSAEPPPPESPVRLPRGRALPLPPRATTPQGAVGAHFSAAVASRPGTRSGRPAAPTTSHGDFAGSISAAFGTTAVSSLGRPPPPGPDAPPRTPQTGTPQRPRAASLRAGVALPPVTPPYSKNGGLRGSTREEPELLE